MKKDVFGEEEKWWMACQLREEALREGVEVKDVGCLKMDEVWQKVCFYQA